MIVSVDYNKILKYVSAQRLQKYLDVSGGDIRRALKLYQANIRLSQSFYPILSLLEVVLRNAINEEMINYFKDPDWLRNQQSGFMSDALLTYKDRHGVTRTNYQLKNDVQQSIRDVEGRKKRRATHWEILANLKFGFWTAMFYKTHFKILLGKPIGIFKNLPVGTTRDTVYDKLMRIKSFRNRIYHYEPIIFEQHGSHFVFNTQTSLDIYNEIKELFVWFDLDYSGWTKKINNVSFEIMRTNCVMRSYPKKTYYGKRLMIGINLYWNKYITRAGS
jgi:hypothetical protein